MYQESVIDLNSPGWSAAAAIIILSGVGLGENSDSVAPANVAAVAAPAM